ncbi:MAG: FKBP-type peptidyl-prolyl cis-trans isomerase [Bacteroidales bacterium]|nr:FKBP-type peptidyl-prolyl cis-trans isomerase [Bacteroidales bacterium]
MKRVFFAASLLVLCCVFACRPSHPRASYVAGEPFDTMSWVLGQSRAMQLMESELHFDTATFVRAMVATFRGEAQPFSQAEYERYLTALNLQLAVEEHSKRQNQQATAVERERNYFAELVRTNPNVKRANAGFYYEVLRTGKGRNGQIGDVAVFDFRAMFTNGQIQEQTYGNRASLLHVIGNPMFPGLQQGMCMMNAGSLYRFYFPYELAFGETGADDIPPYTTMIYEVELHELK